MIFHKVADFFPKIKKQKKPVPLQEPVFNKIKAFY